MYEGYIIITFEEFAKPNFMEILQDKTNELTSQGYALRKLFLKYEVPTAEVYVYAIHMIKR